MYFMRFALLDLLVRSRDSECLVTPSSAPNGIPIPLTMLVPMDDSDGVIPLQDDEPVDAGKTEKDTEPLLFRCLCGTLKISGADIRLRLLEFNLKFIRLLLHVLSESAVVPLVATSLLNGFFDVLPLNVARRCSSDAGRRLCVTSGKSSYSLTHAFPRYVIGVSTHPDNDTADLYCFPRCSRTFISVSLSSSCNLLVQ